MSSNLPKHIAIIMDGNGRWATQKGLSRSHGHREGALAIDRLMEVALELEIPFISLYAFSTENWKRPVNEIQAIFQLLNEFIDSRIEKIHKNGIRVQHSGRMQKIPFFSLKKIYKAVKLTQHNTKMTLNFCLNYGSKEEILNACSKILKKRIQEKKNIHKAITEEELERELYTYPLPPVDLLIRTAGEQRISNFLLWQIAYAEIYFTNTLWPDFNREHFFQALEWYSNRVRKFGGL
jgi:undecaprenyl diphosphate synthase